MRRSGSGAVVAVVGALALAGCSAQAATSQSPGEPDGSATSAAQVIAPSVRMHPGSHHRVAWSSHPRFVVDNGKITSVQLTTPGRPAVPGKLTASGWQARHHLVPASHYRAMIHLRSASGDQTTRRITFQTTPAAEHLSMSATPGPGVVRGVGEAVKVTFDRPVSDHALLERHMTVTTSRGDVAGGWHWFSDTAAHFRPRHFWPAHTKVTVHVDLDGVYAGHGVWGDRNHDWSWQVGNAHVAYVNANTHRFRDTVNGHPVGDWPTDLGMPGFETRHGTYAVISKVPVTEMTSCSIGLSCAAGSTSYYDLSVKEDVRLTNSGTFVHAAPWDHELGVANTSHGCIHLSTADATKFFEQTIPGDVVVVRGTSRAANPTDPGMMDWAIAWQEWKN